MSAEPTRAPCQPFPGLRAFRTEEHHLFFGREDQTAALLTLLRKNRFLAVVGTSGSGKSSLVRAGLIPALHGGTMASVGSHWEVVVFRPGGDPLQNLARALVAAELYDADDPETVLRLRATLSRASSGLVEAVRQSDLLSAGTRLLVVVDQFEELFRYHSRGPDSGDVATAFVSLLLTASEQSENIYIAITMRSDYLGDCSTIPGLAEAVNRGEYMIPRLSRDQRRDAIEKPVGVGGGRIAPRLVQRMLNEVGDDPDQLPVLQHALMRTWAVWGARGDPAQPIDFADFEATGGMAEALSRHADEVFAALPDDAHRTTCERIFRALTEKGADNRGIRRPMSVARLDAITGVDRAAVTVVLDAFRAPGVTLLMPGGDRALAGEVVIDLSHESLMRCWERLRLWVDDEARSARIYRRMSDTARLWRDGKAGLFHDPDLAISESWRRLAQPTAAWAEQYGGDFDLAMRFVDESQETAHAAEREREAARQRELDQTRQLAEEQRMRLEEQRRAARRLRAMLGGLAAVALVAVATSVVAGKFWQDASAARREAEKNADSARSNAALAAQNAETAQTEATRANEQKRLAETNLVKAEEAGLLARRAESEARAAEESGRRLLYATDMQLAPFILADEHASAGQLAARLDVHDVSRHGSPAQKDDLRGFEWYYHRHLLETASTAYAHDAGVLGVAIGADDRVLTLDAQLRLRQWSPETHRATILPGTEEGGDAPRGAVSADGSVAAVVSGNGVRVLDARTGAEVRRLQSVGGPVGELALSADGRRLVVRTADAIVWFDTDVPEPIASQRLEMLADDFRARALSVSADGLSAAVGPHGAVGELLTILRLDPANRRIERVGTVGERGTVRSFALSPDGALVAVGSWFSGWVIVYETAGGRRVADDESGHISPVSALAFSRDGARLATGALDGAIRVWAEPRALKPVRTLKGHDDPVVGLEFSADASELVSCGARGTVRRWDLSEAAGGTRRLGSWRSSEPVFSPDGLLVAMACANRVLLADAHSAQPVRALAGDAGNVLCVAFSPDGRLLAVARRPASGAPYPFRPSSVSLWDVDTGERVAELGDIDSLAWEHEAYSDTDALAFTPDGRYLVAAFGAHSHHFSPAGPDILWIWEVATGRRFAPRSSPGAGCVSIAFSADGRRMATCSHDGTARVWDTETWSVARTLAPPGERAIEDVAFSPDGRLLATANFGNTISLWDVATGALRATLTGHSNAVGRVAFSPDGRTLASASYDGTLRLWNVATATQLFILNTGALDLGRSIDSLAFSPGGRQIAASGDHGAVVWSAAASPWDDAAQASAGLERLLASAADFRSRVRMFSEEPRLHEALAAAAARSDDARLKAALAATRANWHARHGEWSEAAGEFDRIASDSPAAWLHTSGLLRVATALVHLDRGADAASLLVGGSRRRQEDGLPTLQDASSDPAVASLLRLTSERLADRPRDAGLLELRAELAGQWSGVEAQIADYSAAIDALSGSADDQGKGTLARLLRRRGDACLESQAWKPALDDFTRIVAGGANDGELLASRARAFEGLGDWEAAAADWMRAAPQDLVGARRLAGFARRVAKAGRPDLAAGPYDEAQCRYEQALEAGTVSPDVVQELAELLLDRSPEPAFTVLQPEEMTSRGSAKLTALPDGSVLASGESAAQDVFTVVFAPTTARIRAIRIEALPDPSLPAGGPGTGGVGNFIVDLRVLAGNTPVALRDAVVAHALFGLERAAEPSSAEMLWRKQDFAARATTALCSVDIQPAAGERLKLEIRTGPAPGQILGRFRLSVSDVTGTCDCEKKRLAAARLTRPWAKLAAAHWYRGDDAAIERIAARGPDAAGQVGDLFAADRQWERAIGFYDRALSVQGANGALVARRAAAHAGAGHGDAADADWLRAVADQPRLFDEAFGSLALAGRHRAAAQVGRMRVEERPNDLGAWIQLATALALAGDKDAYAEFHGRFVTQFAGATDWYVADAICRAGALLPGVLDPSRLPQDLHARGLDGNLEGISGRQLAWGWATRALLALRSHDAATAMRHVQKALDPRQQIDPGDRALLVAVRALANGTLGHREEAHADVEEATKILDVLLPASLRRADWCNHDKLTTLVLVREAKALLGE